MPQLGELCLWAALPLTALAAAASLAGSATRRGDLAVLGGRASEAATGLLFLTAVGLAHALVDVQLKYSYVSAHSGFQQPWGWRLAGLWSGGPGGILTLTTLMAGAAALGYRSCPGRGGAARTGGLAALATVGVLAVLRVEPFRLSPVPAVRGAGLPAGVETAAWQLELWATYLAVTCAAFALAGLLGRELVAGPGGERRERRALGLMVSLLVVATVAAAWRAYGDTGRLFDLEGGARISTHLPALLVGYAYLHAPGGALGSGWGLRWQRILGVAAFPAAMGDLGALLSAGASVPEPRLWAGGLAVGTAAGIVAGLGSPRRAGGSLRRVPGFGPFALGGAVACLVLAGLIAVWRVAAEGQVMLASWTVAMAAAAATAVWSVSRPAGRWRRPWLAAPAAALAGGAGAFWIGAEPNPAVMLAAGLVGAMLVGGASEALRTRRARRALEVSRGASPPGFEAAWGARSRRRRGAALAHLAVALAVLGLAAETAARRDTAVLSPGERLEMGTPAGGLSVTYLGLSRYQVDERDKRVASFALRRGGDEPELVTAELVFDWDTREQYDRPAVRRMLLGDVIVELAGLRPEEAIACRLTFRPAAGLVWLAAVLLLAAGLDARRTAW